MNKDKFIEDSNVTESKKITEEPQRNILPLSGNNNLYLTKIIDKMWEIVSSKGIEIEQLMNKGMIYYRNGNDGTDFDWQVNDHTCEFEMFYKSSNMGCIKAMVQKDDKIWGCFWGDEGRAEGEVFEEDCKIGCPEEFAAICYEQADLLGKYDRPITEINWNVDTHNSYNWMYDYDEDEDDWYDEEYGDEEIY